MIIPFKTHANKILFHIEQQYRSITTSKQLATNLLIHFKECYHPNSLGTTDQVYHILISDLGSLFHV